MKRSTPEERAWLKHRCLHPTRSGPSRKAILNLLADFAAMERRLEAMRAARDALAVEAAQLRADLERMRAGVCFNTPDPPSEAVS